MIAELIWLVPPPAEPKGVPSAEEWKGYEAAIGCPFPADYKEIFETYGLGWFADWLKLYPPNEIIQSIIPGQSLLELGTCRWENPCPRFPQAEGILLCGHDDGNSFFAWHTQGSPSQWTLINFDNDFREGSQIALNYSWLTLLVGWFSGEIVNDPSDNEWYPEDIEPTQERFFRQG